MTDGLVGSASSDSRYPFPREVGVEPTRFDAIKDPVLRAAVMRAYRAWAWAKAPWLLEESPE